MSREGDEDLLFEFACWNDDIRNTRGIPTLMDRVRAFLAEREPAPPSPSLLDPLAQDLIHASVQPFYEPRPAPPATEHPTTKAWKEWAKANGGDEWDKVPDIERELGRGEPCRHGIEPGECAECDGGSSPELPLHEARQLANEIGVTVPGVNAPPATRYWRVCPTGWGNVFMAYECDASGRVTLSLGGGTREEAEADGRATGLPEWKPPGGA